MEGLKKPKDFRATQRREVSESQSREWIANEVMGCEFKGFHHRKRLLHLLEQFSGRVDPAMPWVFWGWADTKAAHRFFAYERISAVSILAEHFQNHAGVFAACEEL